MFRREAYERVGGYRPEFYFGQDGDLWLRMLDIGGYAVVPETLYAYRVRETSISASRRMTQHRFGELARECRTARIQGRSEEAYLRAAMALVAAESKGHEDPLAGAYFIGRCLVARGDHRAYRYLARAIRRHPWSFRVWLGALGALVEVPWRLLAGRSPRTTSDDALSAGDVPTPQQRP
jgi:hypothetical protein